MALRLHSGSKLLLVVAYLVAYLDAQAVGRKEGNSPGKVMLFEFIRVFAMCPTYLEWGLSAGQPSTTHISSYTPAVSEIAGFTSWMEVSHCTFPIDRADNHIEQIQLEVCVRARARDARSNGRCAKDSSPLPQMQMHMHDQLSVN